jgi:hypothetical protein
MNFSTNYIQQKHTTVKNTTEKYDPNIADIPNMQFLFKNIPQNNQYCNSYQNTEKNKDNLRKYLE